LSELESKPEMYGVFVNHKKYKFSGSHPWLTYKYVIEYCKNNVKEGEAIALMNNDIFMSSNKKWGEIGNMINVFSKAS
jgi:hypothetical protein